MEIIIPPFELVSNLVIIIPFISIQVRRLRDVGLAPVLVLLNLIPIVNLVLLFWYLQPSNSYDQNKLKTKVSSEEMRLEELKSMLDRGVINEEEYNSIRKKTLGL